MPPIAWSPTGATYFESVNRNKESVCLDLTDPEDLALARELALRADVVVENFKPGGLERLGLGYADLRARLPWLDVLGGCCGTDLRHVEAIAAAVAG